MDVIANTSSSDGVMAVPISVLNDAVRAAIASVQAESSDAEILVDVPDVEIVKTGIEYDLASGPTTFTPEDLADAVKAVDNPNISVPRITLGHDGPLAKKTKTSDEPSVGTVHNMRVTEDGQTLLGDFKGVPSWLADILASAYPSRSMEGNWNVKKNGHEYRLVITAVSLLGVCWPGCSSIEDLQELYSKEGPKDITVIEASKSKETSEEGEEMAKVKASVGSEDVRRSFYETVAVEDRMWWWITAHYEKPPLLIAEDQKGDIHHVKYSFNGDDVVFEEPVAVKIQYVEEESGKVAANNEAEQPVAVFASRSESRPETPNKEGTGMKPEQIKLLRGTLGLSEEQLPDDADEDTINAALSGKIKAEGEDKPGEGQPDPPAQPAPKPGEQPEPPAAPAATPSGPQEAPQPGEEKPAEQKPAEQVAASSGVTVDKETWEHTQAAIAEFKQERAKNALKERDTVIEAAVGKGKFPPSRKDHYKSLWDKDPQGTKEFIESLAEDQIPVEARASGGSDVWATDEDPYPKEWLPEVADPNEVAASAGSGQRHVVVGGD